MRETLTIIALAIGSLCLAYIFVSLERMRKAERAEREARRNARTRQLMRDVFAGDVFYALPPSYNAEQNARLWQAIQDRLAVDALVGPSTYEGGE